MPTVDSKKIIKRLLDGEGYYLDDPRAYSIHMYTNHWGKQTFHISYNEVHENAMYLSPFVHAPIVLLWNVKDGFTTDGLLIKNKE